MSERRDGADQAAGDNPFWDYSLRLYGQPGVAEACLTLQDRAGADVNLLLFCCYAGSRGQILDEGRLDRLQKIAGDWNERVVVPLRAARRWLKTRAEQDQAAGRLRDEIKALELQAERQEQDRIHAEMPLPELDTAENAVAENLQRYLKRLGVAGDSEPAALLRDRAEAFGEGDRKT